jgi:hypothetical protein
MVGGCDADSRFFILGALTNLAHDRIRSPAGAGRSLLAASMRAGDPEALAGGLAKAVRDYASVGSSLQAHGNKPLRVQAVRVLRLMAWLLAEPGVGEDAAWATPPGAALDLVALAGEGREADPENVSGDAAGRAGPQCERRRVAAARLAGVTPFRRAGRP